MALILIFFNSQNRDMGNTGFFGKIAETHAKLKTFTLNDLAQGFFIVYSHLSPLLSLFCKEYNTGGNNNQHFFRKPLDFIF